LLIKYLFLFKVVPEIIDPVMGSFQLGRIKRQLRTIEAANIRIRDLFPLVYPSVGRIQTETSVVMAGNSVRNHFG
jgi:hypothetical protein